MFYHFFKYTQFPSNINTTWTNHRCPSLPIIPLTRNYYPKGATDENLLYYKKLASARLLPYDLTAYHDRTSMKRSTAAERASSADHDAGGTLIVVAAAAAGPWPGNFLPSYLCRLSPIAAVLEGRRRFFRRDHRNFGRNERQPTTLPREDRGKVDNETEILDEEAAAGAAAVVPSKDKPPGAAEVAAPKKDVAISSEGEASVDFDEERAIPTMNSNLDRFVRWTPPHRPQTTKLLHRRISIRRLLKKTKRLLLTFTI